MLFGVAAWSGQNLQEQMTNLLTEFRAEGPLAIETLHVLQNEEEQQHKAELDEKQREFMQQLNESKVKRQVHLKTTYVCGVEEQKLGRLNADSIYELLNKNPQWQGRINDDGEVWLERSISDLSPECKRQAYMSVDANGNLTLFDGPPEEEKVLRTFFNWISVRWSPRFRKGSSSSLRKASVFKTLMSITACCPPSAIMRAIRPKM